MWALASPKNISYLWGFGSLLGVVMVIQVLSGLFLAFYYVSGSLAWDSVVDISREVSFGWCLRLVHSNTASFVFIVLFAHFTRGMIQASFSLGWAWLSGWTIMFLTMMAAFLGYVLPWGQMSFWGATVIINLLSVLPMGKGLVTWLWGGFYVSNFTCSFFYAIHFLVPFGVLAVAGIHLVLLHFTGSSVPGGLSNSEALKIKFTHIFSYKDIVNVYFIWGFWVWALILPDWAADPVNFVTSDLSNSPLHIQPEWYFLHFYAILRSIPNKLGGLIGFVLALVILVFLALVSSEIKACHFKAYSLMIWSFLFVNLLLMWLGSQPVEAPFIQMGQILTFLYFFYFLGVAGLDELTILNWSVNWIANSKTFSSQGTVWEHN